MAHTKDVYQDITNRIIEMLETGTVPWRKPWRSDRPKSLVSGKPYRGINAVILGSAPYESQYWITGNQANQRGGYIRKGEKAWPLVFWKFIEVKDKDTGERSAEDSYAILKRWPIFNVEQCVNVDYPAPLPRDFNDIETAQAIVTGMPLPPTINHLGGNRAFYRPSTDTVSMPDKTRFTSEAEYYSTLFHELGHSTGHPSRLERPDVMLPEFGSDPYAKEELVAEMIAAMLCGRAGIAPNTLDNSAAYIAAWLQQLRDDKRLLVSAASAAQKACDYILREEAVDDKQDEDAA